MRNVLLRWKRLYLSLIHIFKQTIYAVADNDSRPIHTGTLFELKKNQINLVSVDGYRLAYREESIQNDLEISFVVPVSYTHLNPSPEIAEMKTT